MDNNDLIYARTQSDFVDSVLDAIDIHDGTLLDELLNVTRMQQIVDFDYTDSDEPNLDQPVLDNDQIWKQLSQHHWWVVRCLHSNDVDRGFRHQSKKVSCLLAILNGYSRQMAAATTSNDDDNDLDVLLPSSAGDEPSWLLPVFNRHVHELRLLALLGRDEATNDDADTLEEISAKSTIQTCISQLSQAMTVLQRFSSSIKLRKFGVFILVNQMLKTYYALHKFNLCTYSISKAERPLKQYMQEENAREQPTYSSHVITYRYFLGKHLLLKHRYDAAIEHFEYVFIHCLQSSACNSMKNKRQALLYLVILKMLHGATPKMELIEKYQLTELSDLIEPIRAGSLALLNEKLRQYEEFLFDTGLFFLVENLKLVAIRNLFRTYVYQIDQQQTNKIPLESTLLFLLNFGLDQENNYTINELIDILNNMIQNGMIKGYISYKFRTLVVSKYDPFPKQFRFISLLNSS